MFQISTARGGILTFYALLYVSGFIGGLITDETYRDVTIWMGRGFAIYLGFTMVLTGLSELSTEEINLEVKGRPDEPLWRTINLVLAWGSPLAAAWHFRAGAAWDGFLMLCYPAWLIALKLESRRRGIVSGALPPPRFWRAFFYLSLLVCAISFALILALPTDGPRFTWNGEAYGIFPPLGIISILAVLTGAVGCGGKFKD